MAEDKEKLKDFLEKTQFSNETIASIFRELVQNHADETERQHTIRATIMLWMQKYPNEMAMFERQMKKTRETRKNEFAADEEQGQRQIFKFPQSLWNRLTMVVKDPQILSQSNPMTKEEEAEFIWFIEQFPMFVVPDKF